MRAWETYCKPARSIASGMAFDPIRTHAGTQRHKSCAVKPCCLESKQNLGNLA